MLVSEWQGAWLWPLMVCVGTRVGGLLGCAQAWSHEGSWLGVWVPGLGSMGLCPSTGLWGGGPCLGLWVPELGSLGCA